jgi:hypothetical protein
VSGVGVMLVPVARHVSIIAACQRV